MGSIGEREDVLTVPPAIRFQFEELASRICDRAMVDYGDRPFFIREWVLRLEALWRKYVEVNLETEDAAMKAVKRFGDLDATVRILKGGLRGWGHRLIYYQRYRTSRYIWIIASAQFMEFIRLQSSLEIIGDRIRYLAYGSDIFEGVLVVLFLAVWNSRMFQKSGHGLDLWAILCLTVACWLQLQVLIRYAGVFYGYGRLWGADFYPWGNLIWMLALVPVTLVALLCFYSEARRLPDKRLHRL